jgi:protein-tyrosine phosphatase
MSQPELDEVYKVHPRLFIGAYWPQLVFARLKKRGIHAIVNLMEDNLYDPRPLGFSYLYKGFPDETYPPHEYIEEILHFIEKHIQKGGVLVHCAMGLSRSAGIILAYLMKENPSWTWDQALNYVNQTRRVYPAIEIRKSILDYFEAKEGRRRVI